MFAKSFCDAFTNIKAISSGTDLFLSFSIWPAADLINASQKIEAKTRFLKFWITYNCVSLLGAVNNGIFTNKVMDIEDLANIGKQRNACPYYAAKEIAKQANSAVVFTPYNYLLEKLYKRTQNLEVSGNIVIFDEAHNLVSK